MTTKQDVIIAWANEEMSVIIQQLNELYITYRENSGLIQHELIEQAIRKLHKAYMLSYTNQDLDGLKIVDGMNGTPRQVDHFN